MKKKKLLLASLSIVLSLTSLTSCDIEQASNGISNSVNDTISNALPNLYITLAQLGVFAIMVFVFFKFAYKPIKSKLKERQNYIEKNIQDAELKNKDAERNLEDSQMNLNQSHVRADEIINSAKKTAQTSADKILEEANKKAEQIRIQSEKDAAELKEEIKRQAHDEIISTAIAASKEILGRELTNKDNNKVIDEFIDKMNKEKKEQ